MQRQSLGSPGRERSLSKDDVVSKPEDPKRRESSPSSFAVADVTTDDDDEIKPEKPHRCYSSPEKFIHLIPILIFFSFLILYLSSHDPSPQDLAQFHGFTHPQQIIETTDIDDIGRVSNKQLKRSQAFVIRSLRNLQEEIQRDTPKSRSSSSHRKLGDF